MVVETRLVLKEELRIRRTPANRTEHRTVRLRREEVAVEHPGFAPSATPQAEENDVSTTQSANPLSSEGDATRQIVAMFETYEQARAARDKLMGSGFPTARSSCWTATRSRPTRTCRTSAPAPASGVRSNVCSSPTRMRTGYAEGLERGHAMLVVRPRAAQREEVIRILESFDPIDFDERQEQWRGEGWTGVNAGAAMFGAPAAGMAATAGSGVADPATGVRPPTRTGSAGRCAGGRHRQPARHVGPAIATDRNLETAAGREDVIPVIQERLRVGKREVAQGAVRVRSYVVETPAEEQVQLRQESVRVERRRWIVPPPSCRPTPSANAPSRCRRWARRRWSARRHAWSRRLRCTRMSASAPRPCATPPAAPRSKWMTTGKARPPRSARARHRHGQAHRHGRARRQHADLRKRRGSRRRPRRFPVPAVAPVVVPPWRGYP